MKSNHNDTQILCLPSINVLFVRITCLWHIYVYNRWHILNSDFSTPETNEHGGFDERNLRVVRVVGKTAAINYERNDGLGWKNNMLNSRGKCIGIASVMKVCWRNKKVLT